MPFLQPKLTNIFSKYCLMATLLVFAFSCAGDNKGADQDVFDRQNGITKQEIRNTFFGKNPRENQKRKNLKEKTYGNISGFSSTSSSIPRPSKIIAIPRPVKKNKERLISFSVTDQVPLKDVLIELAKGADLDLDLDPNISGGVIINAKNRPLTEVLNRISQMGKLRYKLSDNYLQVEQDLPFAKSYNVDFLADGEIWGEVETNLDAIINDASNDGGSISTNKLANIVTVFASQKDHKKVRKYLNSAKKNAAAQVLIEAKVVEVTLNDSYKTGIHCNWASGTNTTITNPNSSSITNPVTLVLNNRSLFGGDIDTTINFLEEFGAIKAIASPRINALNNQQATLNFTKKIAYFITDVSTDTTTTDGTSNTQISINSTLNEKETGTELTITPSIDLKNNEVTLSVEPRITIQSDSVSQPVYDPNGGSEALFSNEIPIVDTRELKTIAKVASGNVLVIGGVMNEDSTNTDAGIPFLSDIPILGYLFKSTNRVSSIKETVIFIKATIINSSDNVSKYDKELNDNFSSSSRPFFNR
jgi:Flp pilus assembly secretin CpaC